jgi:hypothetical protein
MRFPARWQNCLGIMEQSSRYLAVAIWMGMLGVAAFFLPLVISSRVCRTVDWTIEKGTR